MTGGLKTNLDKALIKACAIIALAMLESVAIITGIDGAYFLVVVAAIAGLAGYEIGKKV